jgi:hypothetical protein
MSPVLRVHRLHLSGSSSAAAFVSSGIVGNDALTIAGASDVCAEGCGGETVLKHCEHRKFVSIVPKKLWQLLQSWESEGCLILSDMI